MSDEIQWDLPAAAGHNLPPLDLDAALPPDRIAALLDDQFAAHRAECQRLRDGFERFLAATEKGLDADGAAKATDFCRRIAACISDASDTHAAVKKPVLAAARQIDAAKTEITTPMEACGQGVRARLLAFQQAQEKQRRAELEAEAKRKADEAARAAELAREGLASQEFAGAAASQAQASAEAAAAPANELSRVHTHTGGIASRTAKWTYRITDFPMLLRAVLAGKAGFELIQTNDAVLKSIAKTEKEKASVPGVEFYDAGGVTIR